MDETKTGELELWDSIHKIRSKEDEYVPILDKYDISFKNISIRYIETYPDEDVQYSGTIDSPHLVLMYVFNGSLHVDYESGDPADLYKNHQYTFYLPGNAYRLTYPAKTLTSWLRVVINKEFIDEILAKMFGGSHWIEPFVSEGTRFIDRQGLPLHPRVIQCIQEISNPPVGEMAHEMYITAKVMELISFNLSYDHTKHIIQMEGFAYRDLLVFNELKEYLNLNYLEKHSLASLSKQFGINQFKLKKGFKALFGNTVFGYINDLKMHKAKMLLSEGLNVTEVASILGYAYPQHFSVAFKRKFGKNPKR